MGLGVCGGLSLIGDREGCRGGLVKGTWNEDNT